MDLFTFTKDKAIAITCIPQNNTFLQDFSSASGQVYLILQHSAFELNGSSALLS